MTERPTEQNQGIHHGQYYADWIKRIGLSQNGVGDAIGLTSAGISKVLRTDKFIEPDRRAKIESVLAPAAASRGMEFKSLLSDEQQKELFGADLSEAQSSKIPRPPVIERLMLTFEDGTLVSMNKPQNDDELRAVMAAMRKEMQEDLKLLVDQIRVINQQMAEVKRQDPSS